MSSEHPAAPPAAHEERLWPGPLGWSFVVGFAVVMVIALVPVGVAAAVAGAGTAVVVGCAAAVLTAPTVAVRDGELRAGRAHIPVTDLGAGTVLDRATVRRALGPGSDARTFVCLRAWIPGAVHIEVSDPGDPTPAWLVSSRRPSALLAAVEAAQGTVQAAHSVQII